MLKALLFSVIPEDKLLKFFKAAELLLLEHKTGKNSFELLRYILLEFCEMRTDSVGISPHKPSHTVCKDAFQRQPLAQRHGRTGRSVAMYFGSLFKKTTGQSYTEYLTACKLSCAEMLLQNGMDVAGSCFSSGFGSLYGFLYSFKKYIGMSPAEYKKSEN